MDIRNQPIREVINHFIKFENDYTQLLDERAKVKPKTHPSWNTDLNLRETMLTEAVYDALNHVVGMKLNREANSAGYNASGQNEAVMVAIKNFYHSTADYAKHDKKAENPLAFKFHDLFKGKERQEKLQAMAAALEAQVNEALTQSPRMKPASAN